MFSVCAIALALGKAASASEGDVCVSTSDCAADSLCVRGACKLVIKRPPLAGTNGTGRINATCLEGQWPNVTNCVTWYIEGESRICESNDVPPYHVPAYCPFGTGQGYCQSPTVGNSTDCAPFAGLTCPCTPGADDDEAAASCPAGTTAVGDVLVPYYQKFVFPLRPDPTLADRPKHMYNNSALTTGNSFQVIGAHLNGVQLKGPAEANGFNVDTSLIPLPCGGHVTPPVAQGPAYHFHKAADCQPIETPGQHGPLVGYAADGFGIYGFGDVAGDSLLDQCNGHFGATDSTGAVTYHYHARDHYNTPGTPHVPYYMGCQGPSKGRCNDTVSDEYDGGSNWCGQGCGFEVCVQPGTDKAKLQVYLASFPAGDKWLDGFSVNPF